MASSKQSPLISLLIVLVGVVLGYLYAGSQDPLLAVPAQPVLAPVDSLKGARVDTQFLSSDAFKSLRVYGELPVVPERGSRNDPF
jgi:hypothetical protein